MGISGLLPLLKAIHKPCSLKKFSGMTIGVDAYGWLHRGATACCIELALGKPTTKYVEFCMHRVRMLIHFGITPYLIFDGDNLPSKAITEDDRRERREKAKALGQELLKLGKTSQAHQELQKAVDVTAEMARTLIEELKAQNVQYIVAPYEADSQMVYLERKGVIDGILSEDSDLLVFGAKRLITKLDKFGECVEINRSNFTACREVSLVGWTDADFRRMAMLSGCDYLPSIGSMGLKTAHRMLRKHKTVDRVVKAAQFDGKFKVPAGYLESFIQAERTFLYQWVFCPLSKKLVHLTNLEDGIDVADMPYLGEEVPANIAIGVAQGDLHPHTKKRLNILSKPISDRRSFGPHYKAGHSHGVSPSRRASAPIQTPDLKHSKPIDSFFKPRRTPLAELDPNSFTPSPSQQALLEQQRNNSGWAAVPVPQSLQRASLTRTMPQPPRRVISEPISGRRSAPNPSKRQRLCSDIEIDTPGTSDTRATRSRFFESSLPEPSPSLRPRKKSRSHKGEEFELYSDDSVEAAMAEIVDLEEAVSQPKKKMKIFQDEYRSSVSSGSQSTVASGSTTDQSQESTQAMTPATSFGSTPPPSALSTGLSQQMKDFRSKFSYGSSISTSISLITSNSFEAIPSNSAGRAKASPISDDIDKSTQALDQTPKETMPLPHLPENEDNELEDSAWSAMEAEIVVAASDTDPQSPAKASPTKHSSLRGSEDFLVQDSEAESECSPRKPMFNLGRFAFAG